MTRTLHRSGEHDVHAAARRRKELKAAQGCDIHILLELVEKRLQIPKAEICSRGKSPHLVFAKEVLIVGARRLGTSLAEVSDVLGINASSISRRYDAARTRMKDDERMTAEVEKVVSEYRAH